MREFQIVYYLNHLGQGTKLDWLAHFISAIPVLIILWLIIALLALIFDKKRGKWVFLGSIIVVGIYFVINDLILKYSIFDLFILRTRPYLAYPSQIIPSGETWRDSSFPSGHMAITVAFTTFFLYFYRKLGYYLAGIFLVILMAFARIHNGMHYPSDVFGGAVLGIGYGLLGVYLLNKIKIARLAK